MSKIEEKITGIWQGEIKNPEGSIKLKIYIECKDHAWSGTLSSSTLGAQDIPLNKVSYDKNVLKFEIPQMMFSFEGKVESDTLSGEIQQKQGKMPITFHKAENKLPGNPSLVSSSSEIHDLIALDKGSYTYKVEDYFQRPKSSAFQLSPNGQYMSFREKDDKNKRHVYVKEIKTGEVKRVIEEGEELVRSYGWVNDNRLCYAMDKGGDENYHIYAVDISGENNIDLTPYDGVQAQLLKSLKEQPDYIIIGLNLENKQIFEPYKLNVNTGEMTKLYTNADPGNPIVDYDFDKDGNLRGFTKMENGIRHRLYIRLEKEKEFQHVLTTNWDETFSILMWDYASGNLNQAYVLTNLDSDKARIILYDFESGKKQKEIFSNNEYDVSILGASRKRNWEIDYLGYEGEKVEIIPVSDTFKKVHNDLSTQFEGYEFMIADKTDEEDRYLIVVQSDKLYGRYYEYSPGKGKATLLYDLMPQLKEEDMAEMRPISFRSRDGLKLHGYITLPKKASKGEKIPLVVNPHGGPQGVRDSWGFNPESQLFASRGYATLQVNFRISGGYGKDFLRKGFGEVGRKVMDDVEDGVRYVIDQGWIDPNRVAIYGASHGGYATLMGLVKTPDLYVCGVNYVGVSNIETLLASIPEYWKPYLEMLYEIWYDLRDAEEAAIAQEVSPLYQVEKIKKPLFVVQGANDPRVNIKESDQIVEALRGRGYDVPYMVKYNEGHGFGQEENRLEFYKAMMGFLSKYLDS
ncbi:MAG TPA: S9 family peptidase [Sphingobacterium sp.]|nr:S9 family peptidase [Sphingobacterium sp.]